MGYIHGGPILEAVAKTAYFFEDGSSVFLGRSQFFRVNFWVNHE